MKEEDGVPLPASNIEHRLYAEPMDNIIPQMRRPSMDVAMSHIATQIGAVGIDHMDHVGPVM